MSAHCCGEISGALSPAETFTFFVPASLGSRSSYWNSPLHTSGFPAMLPAALDAVIAPGQIQILILLNPSLLHDHLTAADFLRMQRFHAARRRLINAEPELNTVTKISYETGFYHLGRFAGCYQQLFHELPSRTLQRYYREQGEEIRPLIEK